MISVGRSIFWTSDDFLTIVDSKLMSFTATHFRSLYLYEMSGQIETAVEQAQDEEWIVLTAFPNYDIQSHHPFLIRKRSTNRIIALTTDKSAGYIRCTLDNQSVRHHRIIAGQFIPNPLMLREIDHINHIRSDNRLENLRWVSTSETQRNKIAYTGRTVEYLDELPEDSEPLTEYHGRTVAPGHYRQNNEFFVEVGGKYRKITHTRRTQNTFSVQVRGTNGERVLISWTG
jgi:hypothetical protein